MQRLNPPFFNPAQPWDGLPRGDGCSENQFSSRHDLIIEPPKREPQLIVGNQMNHIEHQCRIHLIRGSRRQVGCFSNCSRPSITESPGCNRNTPAVGVETINLCLGKQGQQPDRRDSVPASDVDHLTGRIEKTCKSGEHRVQVAS